MKTKHLVNIFLLLLIVCALSSEPSSAQSPAGTAQHFAKDGLSFDYPASWMLTDKSNATRQEIVLTLPDNSAVIQLVAFRELLQSTDHLLGARQSVTLPYAMNLAKQLGSPESQLWENADCLPVGKRLASGFKLTGKSEKQPITGYVYSIVLGRRYVSFVYIRADKDDARGAEGWKMLLDTIQIEPPASQTPDEFKLDSIVSGGVLNGRAIKKTPPEYPSVAKAERAQGTVTVQIKVDENGNVIEARAVSGHPLLRGASEQAARKAKFTPTKLCGNPVKVSGLITYNFVLQY